MIFKALFTLLFLLSPLLLFSQDQDKSFAFLATANTPQLTTQYITHFKDGTIFAPYFGVEKPESGHAIIYAGGQFKFKHNKSENAFNYFGLSFGADWIYPKNKDTIINYNSRILYGIEVHVWKWIHLAGQAHLKIGFNEKESYRYNGNYMVKLETGTTLNLIIYL